MFMQKLIHLLVYLLIGYGVANAQTKLVRGTVVYAEDNEPIIGASVAVKGTAIGTTSDVNGTFSLNVPSGTGILLVSYLGTISQEVAISDQMMIKLKSDMQNLDEVIVVAYGTTKKTSFTGSASVIASNAIEKRPITSLTSALEGNSPGIQVTSGLGQPGESASIRIRGFGSVNASSAPLYIVDGAIYNGNISNLNPNDIESISILKDAASTSLYGSSAGNGVIMITTKKGTSLKTNVNLNITQGWSTRAYKDYKTVNVWEYYPLQWEMLKNAYITSGSSASDAASLASKNIVNTLMYNPYSGVNDASVMGTDGQLNPNITGLKWGDDLDWEDAAYGTGYRQEYNLSYSSRTDKSDTYASVAYLDDSGYMIETDFERYSGRINHNINPVKWFKSGLNVTLSRTKSNYSMADTDNTSAANNLTRFVRSMSPIYPIHKHDLETGAYLDAKGNVTTDPGSYVYDYDGKRLSSSGRHGIAESEMNKRETSRVNTMGRAYVTFLPIEGLSITSNYSLENNDLRRKVYENPYVGDGSPSGRLNILSTRTFNQTFNQLANYNKSFGLHHSDLMIGHENYSYQYEYMYALKAGEIFEGVYDFKNFTNINTLSSYTLDYKKEGYFGRLNYDYDNKYYASVSYRRDGTSRFSKNNRWGNFWSFGGSWRISQENFLNKIIWINNLKVRASYGETGNDAVLDKDDYNDYYPWQTLYDLGINNGSEAGVYFSSLSNPDLKWEKQISSDFALEFALFDRLSGTIEYFNKASSDLLFSENIPSSIGSKTITRNIGKSKNYGVEIDLQYKFVKSKDWEASAGFNVTWVKNKIVRLPESNREKGIIDGTTKLMEGYSMYEFWLRQWYGVDPQTGNGLYYLDTEAYNETDGTITNTIRKTLVEGPNGEQLTNSYSYAKYDFSGHANPNFIGGFNFNVAYKNFELGTVFSYQLGGKIIDLMYSGLMNMSSYGNAMHSDAMKAWKKEGDITDVPRLDNNATHATNVSANSTRMLVSSDYLNLRSVTLSYSFPKKILQPIQLSNVRMNLSAENLFMIKSRQGLNPMANFTGITYNLYMPARNITLGLNLSF